MSKEAMQVWWMVFHKLDRVGLEGCSRQQRDMSRVMEEDEDEDWPQCWRNKCKKQTDFDVQVEFTDSQNKWAKIDKKLIFYFR